MLPQFDALVLLVLFWVSSPYQRVAGNVVAGSSNCWKAAESCDDDIFSFCDCLRRVISQDSSCYTEFTSPAHKSSLEAFGCTLHPGFGTSSTCARLAAPCTVSDTYVCECLQTVVNDNSECYTELVTTNRAAVQPLECVLYPGSSDPSTCAQTLLGCVVANSDGLLPFCECLQDAIQQDVICHSEFITTYGLTIEAFSCTLFSAPESSIPSVSVSSHRRGTNRVSNVVLAGLAVLAALSFLGSPVFFALWHRIRPTEPLPVYKI